MSSEDEGTMVLRNSGKYFSSVAAQYLTR